MALSWHFNQGAVELTRIILLLRPESQDKTGTIKEYVHT
jgi:hypothetical protein